MRKRRLILELCLALCDSVILGFALGYILTEGSAAFRRWQVWVMTAIAMALFCFKVRLRLRWEQQDQGR